MHQKSGEQYYSQLPVKTKKPNQLTKYKKKTPSNKPKKSKYFISVLIVCNQKN